MAFLSSHTGLPRAAPGHIPISSLPPASLYVDMDADEIDAFPLLLPPTPLMPPRLGLLYWLAWIFVLSQALGPMILNSWGAAQKRKNRRRQSAAAAAGDAGSPAEGGGGGGCREEKQEDFR